MNRDEVSETVIGLIKNALVTDNDIELSDRLKEDLDMDSIGFVELGSGLEDKYLIDIPDETLENLDTVKQVVDIVFTSPSYED